MAREDLSAWDIFFRSGDIGAFGENRNWFDKSTADERERNLTTGGRIDYNLDRAGDAIADGYGAVSDAASEGYDTVRDVVSTPLDAAGELFGDLF